LNWISNIQILVACIVMENILNVMENILKH
jgi:hypothetical protein